MYEHKTYKCGFIAFEYEGAVYDVENAVELDDPQLLEMPAGALAMLKSLRADTDRKASRLMRAMMNA